MNYVGFDFIRSAPSQWQEFLVLGDVDFFVRANTSSSLGVDFFKCNYFNFFLIITAGIGQCVGNPISANFPISSAFWLLSSNAAQASGSPFNTDIPFLVISYFILYAIMINDIKIYSNK